MFQRESACSLAPRDAISFDSAQALARAGDYDLVLVSEWEHEAGRSTRGRLRLEPTYSVHRTLEESYGRQRHTVLRDSGATCSSLAMASFGASRYRRSGSALLAPSLGRLQLS